MIKDQAVRERVLDVNTSFLLQAPAGSGKTSILVQRFLKLLANAHVGPEEIIAITFTKKAAAEMRERILDALQLATETSAPKDPYFVKLWELGRQVLARDVKEDWQLLNNPARLKIQTIDSLCASIARQMPILSNFGAQPQITQRPERLYALAVEHLLQSLEQTDAIGGPLFNLLLHLDNDRSKVKKLLINMLQKREHWLPTIAQHMSTNNLRTYLEQGLVLACEEALEDLNALTPSVLDVAVMSHEEPQSLKEWLEIVDKLLTADGSWRKQVTAAQGFHPPSKATNKDEKQRLQAAKDAMHAMLARLQPHEEFRQQLIVLRELPPLSYSDQQWNIVSALLEVLPLLAAQLTLVFRDKGQVDFVAVALAALSALSDQEAPTDLSLALDCKIRHILVDEFQDTSHIQFNLLEKLTANWDSHDGRTLFLVGDPMQSIYRFRQADVGLFLKAKDQGIGNIYLEFAQLTVNFRSTANVMQWINDVSMHSFPKADNKTLGAITYMAAEAANAEQQDTPAVSCIAVNDSEEPAVIIDLVKMHMSATPTASIAILVRARNHLYRILPALRAANIAFQGVEIENLSKRPAMQDLLALTNAFLHLDDRIAWLAILRAPWCGLNLADLQIIAAQESTIFAALQNRKVLEQLSASGKMRAARLLNVMHNHLSMLGRNNLTSLVRMAYADLGGEQCLRDISENEEITAFYNLLETLENEPEISDPGFLEQQLDYLYLEPSNDNQAAVQIMTMHKAKGLEFDVVIIPGLAKSIRNQEQELLLLEQRDYLHTYFLVAPIRAVDQDEDTIYKYLAWCERQRAEHEILRQLYVAFTRAKQKIYCLADVADGSNIGGILKKIWPRVAGQFVQESTTLEHLEVAQPTLKRLPSKWFETNQNVANEILVKKRDTKLWQPNWVNQAGTVLHRILAHIASIGIENLNPSYFASLNEICKKYLRMSGLVHHDEEKAVQLVQQAMRAMIEDQFATKILSAKHKESYAEWRITNVENDKLQQLRLDRVFVDNSDILWLVDYKLVQEQTNVSQAIQEYTPQINQYIKVLQQIKPEYKLVAGLYFPLQTYWHEIC